MKRLTFQLMGVAVLATTCASTRIPFSGPLGATLGAGSLVGWETVGQGLNPAIGDQHTLGFLLATYAPFGMEDLRISEAGFLGAGTRWGTGITYRGWEDPVGYSSAIEIREALAMTRGFRAGLSVEELNEGGTAKIREIGTGILWNRISYLNLGAKLGFNPGQNETLMNAGLGGEVGFTFKNEYAIRICMESLYQTHQSWEWRFGAKLLLHSMLSLYGGFNPFVESIGLGLQFGMGRWEGFHAMRIHTVLGSSSLQAIRWKRSLEI